MVLRRLQDLVRRGEEGFSLIEAVVTLALMTILIILLAQTLDISILHTDRVQDRAKMLELAQRQLEDILRRDYDDVPAAYPTITPPEGYSIAVSVSVPVTYTYAPPSEEPAPETVQKITVTVTGFTGSLDLEGFKLRQ
jgi:Tfp pilus assembly protein PilE